MIHRLEETAEMIRSGTPLLISGSAEMMSRLPKGNWIGGTTPYLLTDKGGISTKDYLLVTPLPAQARMICIQRYGVGGLHLLPQDVPGNGFSVVIMPAGTMVHQNFAKEAPSYPGIYTKALTGWVCGPSGGRFGGRPQVFYGPAAHPIEDEAVAIHMELPDDEVASVEIINVYEPGTGPSIKFPGDGFTTTHAIIDGQTVLFSEYIDKRKEDVGLPLVANYCGTLINVGILHYDMATAQVTFYGPVFRNVEYRFAKPMDDMKERIRAAMPKDGTVPVFNCICVSNYTNGGLEDFDPGAFSGPIAFGEIAHQVVNQTITYMRILKKPTI
ncbi:MAG: hypothetical protein WC360_02600 [Opitutales bacterium]|jgi:hypothetical protein